MFAASAAASAAASVAVSAASHLPSLASVRSSVRSSLTSTLDRIQQEAPSSISSTLHLSSLNQHVKDGTVVQSTLQHIEGLAHRATEAVKEYRQQTTDIDPSPDASSATHKRRHADGRRQRKGEGAEARPRRIVADRDAAADGGEKKRKGADLSSKSASRPSTPHSALSTPASSVPSSASPQSPMPTSAPASAPASPLPARPPSPPLDVTVWPTLSPADLLQDILTLLSPPTPPSAPPSLLTPLPVPPPSLFTLPLSSPYSDYAELHAAYLEVARAMEEQEREYRAIYDAIQLDRSEAERERRAMMGEDAAQQPGGAEEEKRSSRADVDVTDGKAEKVAPSMAVNNQH